MSQERTKEKHIRMRASWAQIFEMSARTRKILFPASMVRTSLRLDRPPIKFSTDSVYIGTWDIVGMTGDGIYRLPHGVIYEGEMHDGMFHGRGTLFYPNGCKVEGIWCRGRILERKCVFTDGNSYEELEYDYCNKPDRRFATEMDNGLRPAGRSQITNEHPPRPIPDGCYDTGDGFYNPVTKCLMDPRTGEIKRIPTKSEEQWIMKHCRKSWDNNVGYRRDIYEDWFCDPEESSSDEDIKTVKKYSRAESDMAFTSSTMRFMQEALESIDPDSVQNLEYSGLLATSDANWIRLASRSSVTKEDNLDVVISSKFNTEFGQLRGKSLVKQDSNHVL
ncbi:hypothetical protein L9F63_018765 [Diploptera punctata]|uniref:MORN repeat-containing protein 5 n=1 Tax=Diploptera punctata TaxID=6984 RepID=A0AAD7ZW77_DIPPU|nr:hypothetical protein L9F63_018765 [Diploptera punctata]